MSSANKYTSLLTMWGMSLTNIVKSRGPSDPWQKLTEKHMTFQGQNHAVEQKEDCISD